MAMFQEIDQEHGQRPDILISNAGYGKRITNVWDIELEDFDYMLNINLRASFILVKGVVEHMKAQQWGRIVFMSSIAASGGGINGCRELNPYPFIRGQALTDDAFDRLCGLQGWTERYDEKSVQSFSPV